MNYKPIIGLEIHVELNTRSKMFCACPNDPDEKNPNSNICPICMGHPGTLPVINEEAVRKVIKTGLAFNCKIPVRSKFDRKNYFYPDLPKGYQISQYDMPLCKEGFLDIDGKKIRITRVHLEEDTGRLLHPVGKDFSLVDFNRAGIPLMELVTEPDITSAKEARRFAEELRLILKYLGVSAADMEKGQMRVEVNLSLSADSSLGTKVEIKNLNSLWVVEKSLEYEIARQQKILENGEKIVQETRGWIDKEEITVSQREKEEAHDYRYFPEPDLPPLNLGAEEFLNTIRAEIPELPAQKRERFKKEYSLSPQEIEVFVVNKELSEYFEKVVSEAKEWQESGKKKSELSDKDFQKLIKLSANYILTDLQGLLKGKFVAEDGAFIISPENFAEFIFLIQNGEISSKIAKIILPEMLKTGADPSNIIAEKGLQQITDTGEIGKTIQEVIGQNNKAVEDFKKGKEGALQFLVGQVMAKSKGKTKPETVRDILKKTLTRR